MTDLYKVNISKVRGYWTDPPGQRFLASCLSPSKGGSRNAAVGFVELPPHTDAPQHVHKEHVEEFWYVISGQGKLQIGDQITDIETGDVLYGPGGIPHRLMNPGEIPLKAIWILSPPGDEVPVETNTVLKGNARVV